MPDESPASMDLTVSLEAPWMPRLDSDGNPVDPFDPRFPGWHPVPVQESQAGDGTVPSPALQPDPLAVPSASAPSFEQLREAIRETQGDVEMDDEGAQKLDLLAKQALVNTAGTASVTSTPILDPVGRPSDQITTPALNALSAVSGIATGTY